MIARPALRGLPQKWSTGTAVPSDVRKAFGFRPVDIKISGYAHSLGAAQIRFYRSTEARSASAHQAA